MLLTGSPIPLWYIEELENPEQVVAVTDTELILADGAHVKLPRIGRMPTDDPVFTEAIERGVEVRSDGEVIGLIRVQRVCGNDPIVYRRVRVNLSDLAAVLNPSGIAPGLLPPDVLRLHEKRLSENTHPVRVDAYLFARMHLLRRDIERATGQPESGEYSVSGDSGEHDLRTGGLVL